MKFFTSPKLWINASPPYGECPHFLVNKPVQYAFKSEPEVLIGLETKVFSNPQVYEKVTELFQPLKMNLKFLTYRKFASLQETC